VPFDFFRRRKVGEETGPDGDEAAVGTLIPFEGLTEEWRLVGRMTITGRLSDALNKREAIPLSEVEWAPIDGSAPFEPAPGLKTVDPYDLIVVLAGEATQPAMTESEKAAHKVHKIAYDVALEAPPFSIAGTVFLYPGSEPERLLERSTEMFVAVVEAVAYLGEQPVTGTQRDTLLVNRFYLRGVEQIDKRTGERPQTLPGAPLGGVSWQDRSR